VGAYQVDAYLPTAAASRRMIEIAVFDFLHAFARAYVLLSGYFIACGSFPLMSFGGALLYTADTDQQKDEISAGRVLCYPNITSRECLRAAFRSALDSTPGDLRLLCLLSPLGQYRCLHQWLYLIYPGRGRRDLNIKQSKNNQDLPLFRWIRY